MAVLIFTVAAIGALAGGIGVVASRLPVHSALSLLLVLGSLAVMYLLLAAQFVAVLQVIVYAGAIVVLFLFVIMLLRGQLAETSPSQLRWQGPVGIVLTVAFLTGVLVTLRTGAGVGEAAIPAEFGTAQSVGRTLFTTFLLPFEVASVILLVGIVAAVGLGRRPAHRATAPDRPAGPSREISRR